MVSALRYSRLDGLGDVARTSATIKKIEDAAANIPVFKPWIQLAQKTGTNLANLIGPAVDLVNSITGKKKDNAKLAEAGQINLLNSNLQSQIIAINQKTQQLTQGLNSTNDALKTITGKQVNGLGSLGNMADDTLFMAKATSAQLQQTLDMRTAQLQSLIERSNQAVQQIINLLKGKAAVRNIILFSLLGLTLLGGTIYIVRKIKHE